MSQNPVNGSQEFCERVDFNKVRILGKVKWYNVSKGYGFITSLSEPPMDYFVHRSAVYCADRFPRHPVIYEGEEVEFAPVDNEKGPYCEEVSLPKGIMVPSRVYRNPERNFEYRNM